MVSTTTILVGRLETDFFLLVTLFLDLPPTDFLVVFSDGVSDPDLIDFLDFLRRIEVRDFRLLVLRVSEGFRWIDLRIMVRRIIRRIDLRDFRLSDDGVSAGKH